MAYRVPGKASTSTLCQLTKLSHPQHASDTQSRNCAPVSPIREKMKELEWPAKSNQLSCWRNLEHHQLFRDSSELPGRVLALELFETLHERSGDPRRAQRQTEALPPPQCHYLFFQALTAVSRLRWNRTSHKNPLLPVICIAANLRESR